MPKGVYDRSARKGAVKAKAGRKPVVVEAPKKRGPKPGFKRVVSEPSVKQSKESDMSLLAKLSYANYELLNQLVTFKSEMQGHVDRLCAEVTILRQQVFNLSPRTDVSGSLDLKNAVQGFLYRSNTEQAQKLQDLSQTNGVESHSSFDSVSASEEDPADTDDEENSLL